MKKRSMGDRIFDAIVYAILVVVFLIVFFPLMYVVSTSFASARELALNKFLIFPKHPTLEVYQYIFSTYDRYHCDHGGWNVGKPGYDLSDGISTIQESTSGKKRDHDCSYLYPGVQRRYDPDVSGGKQPGTDRYLYIPDSSRSHQQL